MVSVDLCRVEGTLLCTVHNVPLFRIAQLGFFIKQLSKYTISGSATRGTVSSFLVPRALNL